MGGRKGEASEKLTSEIGLPSKSAMSNVVCDSVLATGAAGTVKGEGASSVTGFGGCAAVSNPTTEIPKAVEGITGGNLVDAVSFWCGFNWFVIGAVPVASKASGLLAVPNFLLLSPLLVNLGAKCKCLFSEI